MHRQYASRVKFSIIKLHSLGHPDATLTHGAKPHFIVTLLQNLNAGSMSGTHGYDTFEVF